MSVENSISTGEIVTTIVALLGIIVALILGYTPSKLAAAQLKREKAENEESKKAAVRANLVKISNDSVKLKIFNKGKSTARNVEFCELSGVDWFDSNEITRKFPVGILEPSSNVELRVFLAIGNGASCKIRLKWSDDYKSENTFEEEIFR